MRVFLGNHFALRTPHSALGTLHDVASIATSTRIRPSIDELVPRTTHGRRLTVVLTVSFVASNTPIHGCLDGIAHDLARSYFILYHMDKKQKNKIEKVPHQWTEKAS